MKLISFLPSWLLSYCKLFADEENMNPRSTHAYHSHSDKDDELSTLPSPSSSVVDIDSNAGTVETEVLLSSYKGSHTSASGTQSVSAMFC